MIRWLRHLLGCDHPNNNGVAAARAARDAAERKQVQAARLWPQSQEARDRLADLIENALRGR